MDIETGQLTADDHGPGGISADQVARDLVCRSAAGELHAGKAVRRDRVAFASGRPAKEVIAATVDQHSVLIIAQRVCTRQVGADEVALDFVA